MTTRKSNVVVTVSTREVGQAFGCCGVLTSVKSGRVLAETRTFPYGFTGPAAEAATALAEDRGYRIAQDGE